MVTNSPCEAPLHLPDTMVRAVIRHAERQADLTGAYLEATGILRSRPARFPAAFLLELAAVLELGLWERRDLLRHIEVDLPTYRQAADQLAARCEKGPAEFQGQNATPLSLLIMQVWIEHFAWDGPDLLNAEAVLSDVNEDDDDFVELLAEFVWTHRHELEHLTLGERQL